MSSTSYSGIQTVDALITILELRGVRCEPNRGSAFIEGIKRLSKKYGDYASVNDNTEKILSGPNVKAVISYNHTVPGGGDGSRGVELASLPMGEESRDVHNNCIVISGAWPTDKERNNTIQFSKEIQPVQISNWANCPTEMSIPASVSLQVGLMLDGCDTMQPLGVATILISGNDQSVELCIPVEADKKRRKFNPKKLLRKEMSSTSNPIHYFSVSSWTMLKIKLDVVTKHYHVNAPCATSLDESSSMAPAALSEDANTKSRLQLLGTQTKSQATILKANAITQAQQLGTQSKSQATLLTSSTMTKMNSFKKKALVALAWRRGSPPVDGAASALPELTVLSPSSDMNTSQYNEGATEIILNSSSANEVAAAANADNVVSKPATVTSDSFDASTANDEDSSVTRTTTVDSGSSVSKSSDGESTEYSIVTEQNDSLTKSCDSKSRYTQGTSSSTDKSSSDGLSDIIITPSRVTFEESKAEPFSPHSPQRVVSSSKPEDLFSEDVTTQLGEIVRVYSMRANANSAVSVSKPEAGDKSNNETQVKHESEPESTKFADIILNTFSADTAPPDEAENIQVLDAIHETAELNNSQAESNQDVQSVVLVLHDKTGARFDVEVSVDGDMTDDEDVSQVRHMNKEQEDLSRNVHERTSQISWQRSAASFVHPMKSFEESYITVKHTMSSIGDLTVDSALDTITTVPTVPSMISKSRKVAKNKRHPQRKQVNDFLRRVSLCGTKYDLAEVMDDAVTGWKDIVVGDELCDGFDYDSDGESTTRSLNTVDETFGSSSFVGNHFCRGGRH